MLHRNDEIIGHLLFLNLEENLSTFMILAMGQSYMAITLFRYTASIPRLLRVFIMKGCIKYVRYFYHTYFIFLLVWCITLIDLCKFLFSRVRSCFIKILHLQLTFNIISLSRHTPQWLNIYVTYDVISPVSLVPTWHHAQLLQCY